MGESKLYLLRGAYFGIGAGVFLFLFILAYDAYADFKQKEFSAEFHAELKAQDELISLEVLDGKYSDQGFVSFIKAVNSSSEPLIARHIEVKLFTSLGKFKGACNQRLRSLEPNETEYIELTCNDKWPNWYSDVAQVKASFNDSSNYWTITLTPN